MRSRQTSWDLDRASVRAALDVATSGGSAALLYEGAPQTGKSWVLDEVLSLVADAGFATARIRVDEPPGPAPTGGGRPVAVAVDDLHLAPPARARELDAAVTAGTSVLWVVAREPGAGCGEVERLCRTLHPARTELGPWTAEHTAAYLAARLGAAPDRALLRLAGTAGGNPALLDVLVDGLVRERFVELVDGGARLVRPGLPGGVRVAVRERLLRLCGEPLLRDAIGDLGGAADPPAGPTPRETVDRAVAEWRSGHLSEGLALARRAVAGTGRGSGDDMTADVEITAAVVLADASQFDECDAVLAAARERIPRTGRGRREARWAAARVRRLAREGRLSDAAALAATGASPPELAVLAVAALRDGDVARSARYVHRCRAGGADPAEYGAAALELAEAQYGAEQALVLVENVHGTEQLVRELLVHDPGAAPTIVRSALHCADLRVARRTSRVVSGLAEHDVPAYRAAALHVRGLIERDAGLLSRARQGHVEPWWGARAVEDIADLAPGPDTRLLQEAMSLYAEAGAARDFARVRSRLRSAGVYDTYARFGAPSGKTFRELDGKQESIVRLVADGLTNQQIASQMFVTPHTVNFHLRKIFRKVGVNSRVELAASYTSWATSVSPSSG